jgi:glycosyltransferase involved in cell wall biosynthesis
MNSPSKILIIYDHFSPAWKAGGPIRSIEQMIQQISSDYHLYVLCSAYDYAENKVIDNITTDKWVDWQGKAKVYYNSKYNLGIGGFFTRIYNEINPDIIFINGLYSLSYNIKPLIAACAFIKKHKQTKLILSPRGMLHPGALSQKRYKKKIFFLVFKLLRIQKYIFWHATDDKEVHFIRSKFRDARISIAGNFPKLSKRLPTQVKERGKLIMGTIALISPMKNHLEIIKTLHSIKQQITWHIYGPVKDQAYWDLCNKAINDLPSNIQVVYHGSIPPDKVTLALEQMQVFILPSKSENFGHSICEALSAGRPVITTDTTPYSNLQHFKAGYTSNLPKLNEGLSKAIQYFADMEAVEFDSHKENAINYIHKKMDLQKIISHYQNLFSIA